MGGDNIPVRHYLRIHQSKKRVITHMDKQLIARVRKMEEDFNLLREVIDTLDGALYDYEAVQRRIKRIAEYQESGQWLKDFEADERGELPEDMPRGVLSEDALDELLNDIASIHGRMDALVNEEADDEEMTPLVEFDPLFDSPDSIPEKPGVLIVTLRYMSSCPGFWHYDPKEFEGLDVLYVDKSENLRSKIVQNYLRGNSAQSSFRYSLGTLHYIPSITLDGGKHWRFEDKDERWLSGWIKENLVFYYKVSPFPDLLALTYTKMYDPALNLDNDSRETEDFRKKLIASRNNHVEKADYDKVKTKASTMRLPKTGKDLESALNEAMADNAARIPDKIGVATVETLIAYQGHEEDAIALVFGGVNDYGEKQQHLCLMAFNFDTPEKQNAFLKSKEGKQFKGKEEDETFDLYVKAGNPKLPVFLASVLKKHLGITDETKLVIKTTARTYR